MVTSVSGIASITAHATSPEFSEFADAPEPADGPYGIWIAVKIGGESPASGSLILLELHSDGAFGGSGGCNRFRGTYRFSRDTIRFDRIGGSMKMCSPALLAQEQRFFKTLEDARGWRHEGNALALLDGSGTILVQFAAQSPAAASAAEGRDARQVERNRLTREDADIPQEAESIQTGGAVLTAQSTDEFVPAASVNATSGARYAGERLVWWTKDERADPSDEDRKRAAPGGTGPVGQ